MCLIIQFDNCSLIFCVYMRVCVYVCLSVFLFCCVFHSTFVVYVHAHIIAEETL